MRWFFEPIQIFLAAVKVVAVKVNVQERWFFEPNHMSVKVNVQERWFFEPNHMFLAAVKVGAVKVISRGSALAGWSA
jgi:hypothetical protein